jgi:bifunctional non-homologous end joining protein LigD
MDLFDEKIKPMLAFSSQPFDDEEWCFELKFDGTRCISYINTKERSVKMLNRRLLYFEDRYPEMKEMWKDVKGEKVILDGEVVVFHQGKPDFYKLAEREHVESKTRIEFLSKLIPATYVVFDILYKDGEDLTKLPLIERKKLLEETVTESSCLVVSQYVVGKGVKFFEEVKKRGLEGLMAKKLDSPYLIGERSKLWLKIKALQTLDVIIVGYTTGIGKREKLIGSLITACYHEGKLKYVGKIGTGFGEEQLVEILKRLEKLRIEKCPLEEVPELKLPPEREPIWVEPKIVCEAKFMNLSKNLIMRAPVFVRLREDKLPEECEV